MLSMLRKRLHNDEDGFTLIELMVVVLIIAILIAIAIPTFLGAQNRARDRGAQSDLRNGITAAKTIATDYAGKFLHSASATTTDTDFASALTTAEGSLVFVTATASGNNIEVDVATDGSAVLLTKLSASDTAFGIKADSSGKVTYCKGDTATTAAAAGASGTCDDAAW